MRRLHEWRDFFQEKCDAAVNVVNDPDAEYTKQYLALGDIKACNILIVQLDLILETATEDEYIERVEKLIERFQRDVDNEISYVVSQFKTFGEPVYDVYSYEIIFSLGVVKLLKEILSDLGFQRLFGEILDK